MSGSAGASEQPVVGVLALQGDVREHLQMLAGCGADARPVRRPAELATLDALVIPGGESTTIVRLARIFDLLEPIRERLSAGMPALGTCAGMIMLADRLVGGAQEQGTFGGLDVAVRRNAFGRQVDSFETDVDLVGLATPLHAVFIRAPWVEEVGAGVEVLARVASGGPETSTGRIVAVRQGRVMATSFHPEISGDDRVHRYFVDLVTT
ncbi:MAG: pyridoxal 5'-phosphate synthase glutaminase subunit PdxT [Nocardioidaceae bacterium]